MVKKGSTFILKVTVVILGLAVLALGIFALPSIWKGGSAEFPGASRALFSIIILMYVTMIPFFMGLWQTLKLLHNIDTDQAFSNTSVAALRTIKRCAITITTLYMAIVPLLLPIAEADDAPGLILFGFALACAPLIIAIFAAVLEKLLQNAIDMKSENELTV
jgi:hypothetical protein